MIAYIPSIIIVSSWLPLFSSCNSSIYRVHDIARQMNYGNDSWHLFPIHLPENVIKKCSQFYFYKSSWQYIIGATHTNNNIETLWMHINHPIKITYTSFKNRYWGTYHSSIFIIYRSSLIRFEIPKSLKERVDSIYVWYIMWLERIFDEADNLVKWDWLRRRV